MSNGKHNTFCGSALGASVTRYFSVPGVSSLSGARFIDLWSRSIGAPWSTRKSIGGAMLMNRFTR